MPLEQNVIDEALQEKSLPIDLGAGLQFADENALSSWIEKVSPAMPKGLENYTPEELKSMADNRENKGVQALVDKIKADLLKNNKLPNPNPISPTPTPTPDPAKIESDLPEEYKKQLEEMQKQLKAITDEKNVLALNDKIKAEAKKQNFTIDDDWHTNTIKAGLKAEAGDADIKTAVENHIKKMNSFGLKNNYMPGGGKGATSDVKKIATDFVAERKKRLEKTKIPKK